MNALESALLAVPPWAFELGLTFAIGMLAGSLLFLLLFFFALRRELRRKADAEVLDAEVLEGNE
ncbi:MAG: hypothetical protein AB7S53_09155 [Thiomonas sp.]|jgi:hypothetical protein